MILLMVEPIFLSPQVKRSVIISNKKHGIYELPYELRNNIRFRILGNYERSGKSQNPAELLSPRRLAPNPPPPAKKKNLVDTSKKLLKKGNSNFHMKTRACLKDPVYDCLWKQFSHLTCSKPHQTWFFLTSFVIMRILTQFHLKTKAAKSQKSAKFCHNW